MSAQLRSPYTPLRASTQPATSTYIAGQYPHWHRAKITGTRTDRKGTT